MIESKANSENLRDALLQDDQNRFITSARPLAVAISQRADSSAVVAKKVNILVASIILAVGGFYLATLRNGHEWGDDFSLYILHARNIVEGISYKQTGYIYNPALAMLGPQTYPPVFPLLLSPVYKLWGMNLTAMKIELVIIFILSLLVIFLALRKHLPWPYLIALIAIIGFNPYFWKFKDNIVSDLPFLLFVYLSLFLIHRSYEPDRTHGRGLVDAILISLSIYLAYGTRSIGLVLLLCLPVCDLIKYRKFTGFTVKTAALTGVLIALQSAFLHSDSSYAGQIEIGLSATVRQLTEYTSELSGVLAGSSHKVFRLALFLLISGLAIVGYLLKAKERFTVFEAFVVLYSIPLLILTMPIDVRFLIPVIPLYLFYSFFGIKAFFRSGEKEAWAFLTMIAIIFAAYALHYAKLDYGPIREGIAKKETEQLFDYVRNETNENDVFIFRKPRAFALFTGRKASVWHQPADHQALWAYFRQIRATHIVLGPKDFELGSEPFLRDFISRYQENLQETYVNADFQVYRIKQMPGQAFSEGKRLLQVISKHRYIFPTRARFSFM